MRMSTFLMAILFACCTGAFAQQQVNFSGKVSNSQSLPIAGSTVYLLNTNRGTATDDKGNFTIKNLLPGKYTAQVSAIGYATVNVEVVLNGSTGSIDIGLEDESRQLDAVLVSAQKTE